MHPLPETHRTQLRSLAARHGLSSVRVFGSMARNDATSTSDAYIVTIQALRPLMRERVLRESVQI